VGDGVESGGVCVFALRGLAMQVSFGIGVDPDVRLLRLEPGQGQAQPIGGLRAGGDRLAWGLPVEQSGRCSR
jgi:hypothetical protein